MGVSLGLFTERFIFPQCVHDPGAFSEPFSWTLRISSVLPLKPALTDAKGSGVGARGTGRPASSTVVPLGGDGTKWVGQIIGSAALT